MSNKCTRCGKQRVVSKTYKEKVGTSYVFYKEMSCPDPECQKKVDNDISKEKQKRVRIQDEQDRREEERKKQKAEDIKSQK